MKFLLQVCLTIALCFVLQFFLPWWTLAFGAMVAGFISKNNGLAAFLAGFAGVGILWLAVALYSDTTTHSILTEKINLLLPVNSLLLTTIVGGLAGGMSGLTGNLMAMKK